MYLSDFRSLIANMPTAYHSATAERGKWKDALDRNDSVGRSLESVFRDFAKTANEVCVSRSDLRRLGREPQLERFVMATILWGYVYDRWGTFHKFFAHPTLLTTLTQSLISARAQHIPDWDVELKTLATITGIGLSTYTKFLNFLSVKVHGSTALILDEQIVQVVQWAQGVFVELHALRGLTLTNKESMYPAYLSCLHEISNELGVPAENLEFFLYKFGGGLKDIEHNVRLRAYELYEQCGRIDGRALDNWLQAEIEIRQPT